jgi:hypothetical protein
VALDHLEPLRIEGERPPGKRRPFPHAIKSPFCRTRSCAFFLVAQVKPAGIRPPNGSSVTVVSRMARASRCRDPRHPLARATGSRNMTPLSLIAAMAALACVLPSTASAGNVFQFAPTNPRAGTKYITVRAIPTPVGYEGVRVPGSARVLDLYLIRHADAPTVHSVRDSRLIPLGRFNGSDTQFRLPYLRAGSYAMAAECVSCRPRALYVIGVGIDKWGIAPLMLLHASTTPPTFPMWPVAAVTVVALCLVVAGWIVVRRRRRAAGESQGRPMAATAR